MKKEYLTAALFFVFTAAFFYLFYRLIIPYFAPICWAAVFTLLFFPMYRWLCDNRYYSLRPWIASGLSCVVVVIAIIGPLVYLFVALVNEISVAVTGVNEMYVNGELDNLLSFNLPWITSIKERLSQYYDLSQVNIDQLVKDAFNLISSAVFNQTSWVVANGTKAVFYFILMLFTMYYFFMDGQRLVAKVKRLMPIQNTDQVESIFAKLFSITKSTMYGGTMIALLQGLIGGILFTVLGITSPVLWGALMAFLAIIPIVGASLVYIPAGLIMFLGGYYVKGIIILAVGGIIISQIDNFLRPIVISKGSQIHPLLLFFSIMGGISLFGLLGLVVGPLIAVVFVTILDILDYRMNPQELGSSSEPS